MIRSLEHCIDLIAKRKSLGKKGLPKSVRRYLKRTKQVLPEGKDG